MSSPRFDILTPDDLRSLTLPPTLEDADGGARRLLIVDLGDGKPLSPTDAAPTVAWLRTQSAVVIGVRDEPHGAHPLDPGADVILARHELDACAQAIERNPVAASVLVQVLRTTEHLAPQDALVVESLAYATLQAGEEHRAWLAAERARQPARVLPARSDLVLLERRAATLHVCLNSPDTRNSLSSAMRDALAEAFTLVAMDTSIAAVAVTANGPCFSAGGDLKEFGLAPDPASAHAIRMQRMPARLLLLRRNVYGFHVHGACIGAGIELPAFARRLTARADTIFRLPEVAMGLIPGAGGCVSLPRRIGRQRTAQMALTGTAIGAEQALAWGLVDAIEP
ncbi:MAG TPA: enoyl-CoA hydratase/isomerase family protein [Pseudomonadales bacterium]